MVPYAVALTLLLYGLLWAAVECWRLGRHRAAIVSTTTDGIVGIALIAVIYLLHDTDNPWAWIGLPMACRYTLQGC